MNYRILSGDFETTSPFPKNFIANASDENKRKLINAKTKVWLAAAIDYETKETFITKYMNNFMTYLLEENTYIYFHNAKFDASFIIDWLLNNNYDQVLEVEYPGPRSKYFCGDRTGLTIYSNGKIINVVDTMSMLPGSIGQFGFSISQEDGIDLLKGDTPIVSEEQVKKFTDEDWSGAKDYILRDIKILDRMIEKLELHKYISNRVMTTANLALKTALRHGELPNYKIKDEIEPIHTGKNVKYDKDKEDLTGFEATNVEGHMVYKPIIQPKSDEEIETIRALNISRGKRQGAGTKKIKKEIEEAYKNGDVTEDQYKSVLSVVNKSKHEKLVVRSLYEPISADELKLDIRNVKGYGGKGVTLSQQVENLREMYRNFTGEDEYYHRLIYIKYNQKLLQLYRYNLNFTAKWAYKGGISLVMPLRQNKVVGKLTVLDVVSMYPWIYGSHALPGKVIEVKKYKASDDNDLKELYDRAKNGELFLVTFTFLKAKAHANALPLIKPRTNDPSNKFPLSDDPYDLLDRRAYYLRNISLETFSLTSMEFIYLIDNYDIEVALLQRVQFMDRNHALETAFYNHVMKWIKVKNEAKISGDKFKEYFSKLMLNAPYGKLGNYDKYYPSYALKKSSTGSVLEVEYKKTRGGRDDAEVGAAAFITAYARVYLANTINKIGYLDRFLYCDTDSIHFLGWDIPEGLNIGNDLGQWNIEARAVRGIFLKPKTYAENVVITEEKYNEYLQDESKKDFLEIIDGYHTIWKTTCAGITKQVEKEKFKLGEPIEDRRSKVVNGGTVIYNTYQRIGELDQNYVDRFQVDYQEVLEDLNEYKEET